MSLRASFIIATVIALLTGLGVYLTLGDADAASPTVSVIKDPTGVYAQTDNGIPNVTYTATVTDDSIQITMEIASSDEGDSGASGLYWEGTFDTNNKSNEFVTVSKADVEKLSFSMLGSLDSTKKFHYKNGVLSFKASFMKVSSTVYLAKE